MTIKADGAKILPSFRSMQSNVSILSWTSVAIAVDVTLA